MEWPYHFVDLTQEQNHDRRKLIDRYGIYSQLSALIPIALYQLYRLAGWVHRERQRSKIVYTAVPSSPDLKKRRTSRLGKVRTQWRSFVWWLGGEIVIGYGKRGHWIATVIWLCWLLFLSIHRTGDDYLHVTKRIGEVAVAQLPIHYMLVMKSRYSPLAVAFGASHEQLNIWHQYSAKVFYTLILAHATLYINFFIQKGIFEKRIQDLDVILGVNSLLYLTILTSTSLALVRRWSYRLFFVIHLVIGIGLPIILFFHAYHMRIYVVEALTLFVIDVIMRKLDTVTSYATITPIAHTKLVKVKIPISEEKIHRYHYAPGQHVYVNIPAGSRPTGTSPLSIHELLYNPYTIAEVSSKDITLVLRALGGPTSKALSALTRLPKAKPPLNIEGPLGCTQHFPNFIAKYDKILLIAGGVGATFTLPIYNALLARLEAESSSPDRLKMIWTMRSAAETDWTSTSSINSDPNIEIFITRSRDDKDDDSQEPVPADGSVELYELLPKEEEVVVNGTRARPDLGSIVDELFRSGKSEKVAVMVCGPGGLAREVRRHLGRWVGKGREVWFHDESFGL